MTSEEFSRMLLTALREPKIEAAVLRVVNEHTAKARRGMVERDTQRVRNNAGTLAPKGLRAVTPLTKPK